MTHPIGLAAFTVLELAPPDMVSCAAEAGFASIGLRLLPATAEEVQHAIVGDTPLARETARRIADTGLPVLDIEIFRLKPDTIVAVYRAALETGARFGAREVLLRAVPPQIPLSIECPMHTLAATMPALERARAMLAKTRKLLETL